MKRLVLICLIFASGWLIADTNDARNGMVAAAFSGATYYGCRQISNEKLFCAIGSMVVSELIMLCNISTSDSDAIIKRKLIAHTIGASIALPISILE